MKHKIVVTALTALATIGITFVSCSKDNEGYEERDARLSISVNTAEMPKTKALIEETTLPEGSKIWSFPKEFRRGDYDDGQYNNIEWTASGTGGHRHGFLRPTFCYPQQRGRRMLIIPTTPV